MAPADGGERAPQAEQNRREERIWRADSAGERAPPTAGRVESSSTARHGDRFEGTQLAAAQRKAQQGQTEQATGDAGETQSHRLCDEPWLLHWEPRHLQVALGKKQVSAIPLERHERGGATASAGRAGQADQGEAAAEVDREGRGPAVRRADGGPAQGVAASRSRQKQGQPERAQGHGRVQQAQGWGDEEEGLPGIRRSAYLQERVRGRNAVTDQDLMLIISCYLQICIYLLVDYWLLIKNSCFLQMCSFIKYSSGCPGMLVLIKALQDWNLAVEKTRLRWHS